MTRCESLIFGAIRESRLASSYKRPKQVCNSLSSLKIGMESILLVVASERSGDRRLYGEEVEIVNMRYMVCAYNTGVSAHVPRGTCHGGTHNSTFITTQDIG